MKQMCNTPTQNMKQTCNTNDFVMEHLRAFEVIHTYYDNLIKSLNVRLDAYQTIYIHLMKDELDEDGRFIYKKIQSITSHIDSLLIKKEMIELDIATLKGGDVVE